MVKDMDLAKNLKSLVAEYLSWQKKREKAAEKKPISNF